MLLVFTLPIMAVMTTLIVIESKGSVIYRQDRVGHRGKRFTLLKFRSMELDAEKDGKASWATVNDARVTRIGRLMRRTRIDELPQLINVLRGEMSFVGPRPERPEFVELFEPRVHRYFDRHRVKAGITGWAQVNGLRGQTSLSDRVEWDNYYIENASLWLDLKIIGRTILALPKHSGSKR